MDSRVEEGLRLLYEFSGRDEFAHELRKAKEEFFKRVGPPLPGEQIEELRLASFSEWFIFDRPIVTIGRTPVEEYLRRNADSLDPARAEVFQAFTGTIHSIFLVKKRKGERADLKDMYTGKVHKGVKRVPVSLGKGDMVELRLVRIGDEAFATDALCYHPFSARKQIKRMLKEARKQGRRLDGLLEELMAKNTKHERYPKTAKKKAYAGG